jgi:hypothetical protein
MIARDHRDQFPRKVLKREGDLVSVEIGAYNRGWRSLAAVGPPGSI